MRHGSLMRVGLVVVSLTVGVVGTLAGRSVLAEQGSVAAVSVRTGGASEGVKFVGSTDSLTVTSTTFTPLTSAAMLIPAGHTDLVAVAFSAESTCASTLNSNAGATCIR